MGGLALKNTPTRRYERAEFDVISVELLDILKKDFKRVAMPLFYKNKKSFGDADIIVSMEGFNRNVRDYITETFKPNEIFHNGNCYSFDYKELQVDVITLAPEHFDSNEMYLSYNDLGNFIGRIAQGFGLKYGQEGLWYEHYFKGTNLGSKKPIIISKNYKEIYEFLGLSYERWEAGFDELEDIFEYIATCRFFNWERFQLKTLNKINRERNLKRKSYMSFLEWMDKNVADDDHKYEFNLTQEKYNEMIAAAFPECNLEMEIRQLEFDYCKELLIKGKFTGGEVMRRHPELQNKALGDAIVGFKKWVEESTMRSFDDFIIKSETDNIYLKFDQYLDSLKQTA
jgi:hypothetical protein